MEDVWLMDGSIDQWKDEWSMLRRYIENIQRVDELEWMDG